MNSQRRQVGRRFLCVLVAALVSLLLVVLPFAQTLDASDSGRDSGAPDFVYDDPDIIVTANLSSDTKIPADAEFCVEPITQDKDSEAYKNVETQVNKDVTADHQTVTGFRAYDIYFSADGTRYEPEAGDATVTIQYKDRVFDSAVKKATDEIKVLHLKKSGKKTKVEDVTKAVDVKDLGGSKAKKANSSSEAIFKDNGKDGAENIDSDTVEFVTKSFSPFVVTGVANIGTFDVTMNFYQAGGKLLDPSATGTYYLYITYSDYHSRDGNSGIFRYTFPLKFSAACNGTVTVQLNGLYNQNGQKQNNDKGDLYPLIDGSYDIKLFQYSGTDRIDNNFRWQDGYANDVHYTQYSQNSIIADRFSLNDFPKSTNINLITGPYKLEIGAYAIPSKAYTVSDIMSQLQPVLPYAVFTETFHEHGDMEGSIAADQAEITGNVGASHNNYTAYSSGDGTITVTKTYTGDTQKTFTFGMFVKGSTTPINSIPVQTLTLPDSVGNKTGTLTFDVGTNSSDYDVNELQPDGKTIISQGSGYDRYTLTERSHGDVTASNSNNGCVSYINRFIRIGGTYSLYDNLPPLYNRLIVGNDKSMSVGSSQTDGSWVQYGSGKITSPNHPDAIQTEATADPTYYKMPEFTTVLGNMATLSANLAQMRYTSGAVTVKACKASDLNNMKFDMPADPNQLLLINIDATGSISPKTNSLGVDFPSSISWTVGGVDLNTYCNSHGYRYSNTEFLPPASNVIVNVYAKGATGNYIAYKEGPITGVGYMKGTFLAPLATVSTSSGYFDGRIIANDVTNDGGELHSAATINTGSNCKWTFVNSVYTPFTLPETGGGGTAVFYTTGGAVLLFGAVLAYAYRLSGKRRHIRKRRRKSPNE